MPEPVIVQLQARPFAYVNLTSSLPAMPQTMSEGFGQLAGLFAKAGAQMAGNPLAHYLAFGADTVTFELGFPVLPADIEKLRSAGLSIGQTPSGRNMTATHIGPYDTVSETYAVMDTAMRAHGVTGTKDMWESYMSPPETPPEQIKTEVIWPLMGETP